MRGVKDFSDIPLLFVEGEVDMGAPRKTRAEKLDQIIQFIWDYQDKHEGATPSQTLITRQCGLVSGGGFYYINLLIDEGRLNKIASNPFRATITDHKDNKRAIERFQRIRKLREQEEERERDQIRERQAQEAETGQRADDKQALLETVTDTAVAEDRSPPPSPTPAPERPLTYLEKHMGPQVAPLIGKADRYVTASEQYRTAQRELKTEMPRLIKFADERDLVFELVSRGYTVSKAR
jgi:hypothetical protein